MILKRFKNISGKKINVLCNALEPKGVLEIYDTLLDERDIQEIENLTRNKYIEEIKYKRTKK